MRKELLQMNSNYRVIYTVIGWTPPPSPSHPLSPPPFLFDDLTHPLQVWCCMVPLFSGDPWVLVRTQSDMLCLTRWPVCRRSSGGKQALKCDWSFYIFSKNLGLYNILARIYSKHFIVFGVQQYFWRAYRKTSPHIIKYKGFVIVFSKNKHQCTGFIFFVTS